MKILDLAGSWWFLTSGVTKRLFNHDLETGAACDPRAYLPRYWRKATKGLLYTETGMAGILVKGLLYFNLYCWNVWSKVFSTLIGVYFTLIWNCWNVNQSLLYFNLELLEWWTKFSLLWSRVVGMAIKGFLYFDPEWWNVDQRSSLLQFGVSEMSIKAFSALIWNYWNVDQGLL